MLLFMWTLLCAVAVPVCRAECMAGSIELNAVPYAASENFTFMLTGTRAVSNVTFCRLEDFDMFPTNSARYTGESDNSTRQRQLGFSPPADGIAACVADYYCTPGPCRVLDINYFANPLYDTELSNSGVALPVISNSYNYVQHTPLNYYVYGHSQCNPTFGTDIVRYNGNIDKATVDTTYVPLPNSGKFKFLSIPDAKTPLWPDVLPVPPVLSGKSGSNPNPAYMYATTTAEDNFGQKKTYYCDDSNGRSSGKSAMPALYIEPVDECYNTTSCTLYRMSTVFNVTAFTKAGLFSSKSINETREDPDRYAYSYEYARRSNIDSRIQFSPIEVHCPSFDGSRAPVTPHHQMFTDVQCYKDSTGVARLPHGIISTSAAFEFALLTTYPQVGISINESHPGIFSPFAQAIGIVWPPWDNRTHAARRDAFLLLNPTIDWPNTARVPAWAGDHCHVFTTADAGGGSGCSLLPHIPGKITPDCGRYEPPGRDYTSAQHCNDRYGETTQESNVTVQDAPPDAYPNSSMNVGLGIRLNAYPPIDEWHISPSRQHTKNSRFDTNKPNQHYQRRKPGGRVQYNDITGQYEWQETHSYCRGGEFTFLTNKDTVASRPSRRYVSQWLDEMLAQIDNFTFAEEAMAKDNVSNTRRRTATTGAFETDGSKGAVSYVLPGRSNIMYAWGQSSVMGYRNRRQGMVYRGMPYANWDKLLLSSNVTANGEPEPCPDLPGCFTDGAYWAFSLASCKPVTSRVFDDGVMPTPIQNGTHVSATQYIGGSYGSAVPDDVQIEKCNRVADLTNSRCEAAWFARRSLRGGEYTIGFGDNAYPCALTCAYNWDSQCIRSCTTRKMYLTRLSSTQVDNFTLMSYTDCEDGHECSVSFDIHTHAYPNNSDLEDDSIVLSRFVGEKNAAAYAKCDVPTQYLMQEPFGRDLAHPNPAESAHATTAAVKSSDWQRMHCSRVTSIMCNTPVTVASFGGGEQAFAQSLFDAIGHIVVYWRDVCFFECLGECHSDCGNSSLLANIHADYGDVGLPWFTDRTGHSHSEFYQNWEQPEPCDADVKMTADDSTDPADQDGRYVRPEMFDHPIRLPHMVEGTELGSNYGFLNMVGGATGASLRCTNIFFSWEPASVNTGKVMHKDDPHGARQCYTAFMMNSASTNSTIHNYGEDTDRRRPMMLTVRHKLVAETLAMMDRQFWMGGTAVAPLVSGINNKSNPSVYDWKNCAEHSCPNNTDTVYVLDDYQIVFSADDALKNTLHSPFVQDSCELSDKSNPLAKWTSTDNVAPYRIKRDSGVTEIGSPFGNSSVCAAMARDLDSSPTPTPPTYLRDNHLAYWNNGWYQGGLQLTYASDSTVCAALSVGSLYTAGNSTRPSWPTQNGASGARRPRYSTVSSSSHIHFNSNRTLQGLQFRVNGSKRALVSVRLTFCGPKLCRSSLDLDLRVTATGTGYSAFTAYMPCVSVMINVTNHVCVGNTATSLEVSFVDALVASDTKIHQQSPRCTHTQHHTMQFAYGKGTNTYRNSVHRYSTAANFTDASNADIAHFRCTLTPKAGPSHACFWPGTPFPGVQWTFGNLKTMVVVQRYQTVVPFTGWAPARARAWNAGVKNDERTSSFACDCADSVPVYKCSVPDDSGALSVMQCGYQWTVNRPELPEFGLYIGSQAREFLVVEQDMFQSVSRNASHSNFQRFLRGGGLTYSDMQSVVFNGVDRRMWVGGAYTAYTSGCLRWPYGQIHQSAFPLDIRRALFPKGGPLPGQYLNGYCDLVNKKLVYCRQDANSVTQRLSFCAAAGVFATFTVKGQVLLPTRTIEQSCNNLNICLFLPGYGLTLQQFVSAMSPDAVVLVAPFGQKQVEYLFRRTQVLAVGSSYISKMTRSQFINATHGWETVDDSDDSYRGTKAWPDAFDLMSGASLNHSSVFQIQNTLGAFYAEFVRPNTLRCPFTNGSNYVLPSAAMHGFRCVQLDEMAHTYDDTSITMGRKGVHVTSATLHPIMFSHCTGCLPCTRFVLTAPRITLANIVFDQSANCETRSGYSAAPVIIRGSDASGTVVSAVVVGAYVGVLLLGFDSRVSSGSTLDVSNVRVDIVFNQPPSKKPGNVVMLHPAAFAKTDGTNVSVVSNCDNPSSVLIQALNPTTWPTITPACTSKSVLLVYNLSQYMTVFGAAEWRQVFATPPEHALSHWLAAILLTFFTVCVSVLHLSVALNYRTSAEIFVQMFGTFRQHFTADWYTNQVLATKYNSVVFQTGDLANTEVSYNTIVAEIVFAGSSCYNGYPDLIVHAKRAFVRHAD